MMDTNVPEPKMQLVLEAHAWFDWLNPPANQAEAAMRERANTLAAAAMVRLEPAIKVLVMELLTTDAPSNAGGKPHERA